jgi:hypothetical protein
MIVMISSINRATNESKKIKIHIGGICWHNASGPMIMMVCLLVGDGQITQMINDGCRNVDIIVRQFDAIQSKRLDPKVLLMSRYSVTD